MEADRWLGLDLRHLIALKAIADEGSFGKAAEKLGYTQSAISQQIAALERIVGLRLIERDRGVWCCPSTGQLYDESEVDGEARLALRKPEG